MNRKELLREALNRMIVGDKEGAEELISKVMEQVAAKFVAENCGRPHGKEQEEQAADDVEMEDREDMEDEDMEDVKDEDMEDVEDEDVEDEEFDEEVYRKALEDLEDADLAMKIARAAIKWRMEEEREEEEGKEPEHEESEEMFRQALEDEEDEKK